MGNVFSLFQTVLKILYVVTSQMDGESVPPTVPAGGFLNGNETVFNYTDDDVHPEPAFVRSVPGW